MYEKSCNIGTNLCHAYMVVVKLSRNFLGGMYHYFFIYSGVDGICWKSVSAQITGVARSVYLYR